jgi:pyruvate/2-oxoglutarate/acetoin dehydrogenase E1 component
MAANYHDELCEAMKLLAAQEASIFVGQGMFGGTSMFSTLEGVPMDKRLEFPVAEDFQMGFCLGLSLKGLLPISVYPRWNFLLLAANQLVNHLDRYPLLSDYRPKVIIRTAIPSTVPFNPGPQHDDDFTQAFRSMLRTVDVVRLRSAGMIVDAYEEALKADHSTLLVEYTDQYKDQRGKE